MEVEADFTPSLCISGAGFLGIYEVGAVAALTRACPHLVHDERVQVLGASAGALIGAAVVSRCSLEDALEFFCKVAEEYSLKSWGVGLALPPRDSIYDFMRPLLLELLPQDAYLLCSKRLHVSITEMDNDVPTNRMITKFDSNEDLVEALITTAYIPHLTFEPHKEHTFRGKVCVDGGYTNNCPRLDEHTIVLCPLIGDSDISPPSRMTLPFLSAPTVAGTSVALDMGNLPLLWRAINPSHPLLVLEMLQQGYADGFRFLVRSGLACCDGHRCFFQAWRRKGTKRSQPRSNTCESCRARESEVTSYKLPARFKDFIYKIRIPKPVKAWKKICTELMRCSIRGATFAWVHCPKLQQMVFFPFWMYSNVKAGLKCSLAVVGPGLRWLASHASVDYCKNMTFFISKKLSNRECLHSKLRDCLGGVTQMSVGLLDLFGSAATALVKAFDIKYNLDFGDEMLMMIGSMHDFNLVQIEADG